MDRRTWLLTVVGAAASAAGTGGCVSDAGAPSGAKARGAEWPGGVDPDAPPPPPTVPAGRMSVPLADLPVDARTVVRFQNVPVEIHRTARKTTARILVCTHWGCVVRWVPEKNWYQCPCHDGRFDEDGDVKVGPPQKALLKVPFRIDGDVLVLGS